MLAVTLLTGCRTRNKSLGITEYRTAKISRIQQDSAVETKDSAIVKNKIRKTEQTKEKSVSEDIEIRGKTDSIQKDFDFHNVVNGDTLQVIHISGNADFVVKTRRQESQQQEISTSDKEDLNIIAKVARKAVAQSTIEQAAGKIKEVTKEVKSTGFQWPAWLIVGICAIALLVLWYLGISLKSWKK